MQEPVIIDADGKVVTVKFMDDCWVINECAGAHPFKPRQGTVWRDSDRCARLPGVPGCEFQSFFRNAKDRYGNCAAVAWHEDRVLGHLVWLPRIAARQARASGWEFFGPPHEDDGVLTVVNLAFCSLSGHEFRGKGVGMSMVGLMTAWARENGWKTIEVYDTPGGLFPGDWLDSCIPPKPFWQGRGFTVFAHRPYRFTSEELSALLADNPRNSDREQAEKQQIVTKISAGVIDASQAGRFDLRLAL